MRRVENGVRIPPQLLKSVSILLVKEVFSRANRTVQFLRNLGGQWAKADGFHDGLQRVHEQAYQKCRLTGFTQTWMIRRLPTASRTRLQHPTRPIIRSRRFVLTGNSRAKHYGETFNSFNWLRKALESLYLLIDATNRLQPSGCLCAVVLWGIIKAMRVLPELIENYITDFDWTNNENDDEIKCNISIIFESVV